MSKGTTYLSVTYLAIIMALFSGSTDAMRNHNRLQQRLASLRKDIVSDGLELAQSQTSTSAPNSLVINTTALLALRTNASGYGSTYSDIAYYFLKDGYNQIKYQYNYSIANKTSTPPSGSKGDFMMLSPYFWHPTTIATSSSIGQCANCVKLKAAVAAGTSTQSYFAS